MPLGAPKIIEEKFQKIKQKFIKTEIINKNESLKSWIQIAEEKHEFYCSTLGTRTWEEYRNNERQFLKLKLGFAIFGPPSTIGDDDDLNFNVPIQNKIIENIVQVIEKISKSEDIYLAFIYIIGNVNGEHAEFPIIRVLKESDGCIARTSFFIDILGRVYKNWNEFLENNIFPKCIYCYPKNGFYSRDKDGNVQLDFGYSPACKKLKVFAKSLDTLSDVAMVGSVAIGLTALTVPITTPVLVGSAVAGVTSGVWASARSTNNLVDRKKHGQSIDLLDVDARIHWLSLVSSILGAAGAGAMHYSQLMARTGQVLSKVPSMFLSTIQAGCSISSGSLYIINQIMTLIQNKELNSIDSAQLALSILFFYHTKIDTKSITKMLLKLQKDVIIDIKKQITSERKTIMEYILEEWRKKLISDGTQLVKSLKIINNFDNLEDLFRTDNSSSKVKSDVSITSYDEDDWVIVYKDIH